MKKRIILIGIQGSGKSTQGNLLSEKTGFPYLSTGHIFRSLAKEHTTLGRYIKETMNAGYLIPDAKTMKIVGDYLSRAEYSEGWILDGFPRTIKQAESFKQVVEHVIYLKVSDKEALWRLSLRNGEAREDDTLAAIRKRIDLFHRFTEPVIEYYRKKGLLKEVNGEETVEQIHKDIMESLQSS